jgi:two-component system sensor histidine kinase PhoQ
MISLRSRLLLTTAMVLALFIGLGGIAMEHAFLSSLGQAQQQKLQGLVYSLLGAASPTADGALTIAIDAVPDPRLRQPLSGLDAALFDDTGRAVWSSAAFLPLSMQGQPEVGEWHFDRLEQPSAFVLSFGLRWIDATDEPRRYTVTVLEDASAYDSQLATFRRILWGWLGGMALALSIVLVVSLRWGLSPLGRLGRELHAVESGKQPQIVGIYPDELQPLTRDLNTMIINERNQQTRYRNALGDLTHSLKTPLAVLRGLSDEFGLMPKHRKQLQEQLGRMQHIVDHQLRRAAAAGSRTLTEPVALRALSDKITAALMKVYASKKPEFDNRIPLSLRLRADQGDLYELLGNLLDNAIKYGRGKVRVNASITRQHCILTIEDDGDGFPENAEQMLERGVRADTQEPGQGLGLAAVVEVIKAYEGKLSLQRSALGGARVIAALPMH